MKLSFHPHSPLRIFAFSVSVTVLSLIAITGYLGPGALLVALILIAVELAFSFDNAIINAKILKHLSPFWQKLFLTVGILIAIFGMRVVFPVLIVMLTADLSWKSVVDLALNHPKEYAEKLDLAHPTISAFGGGFLLMLALHFFMDDDRHVLWLKRIERPLMRYSRWWVPALVAIITVAIFSLLPFNHHPGESLRAGLAGIVLFLAINIFTEWVGKIANQNINGVRTGWAAFLTFMYLEVLDASFSLDGVIGAFAITNDVILIAAGLGIGAIWVRSLTVYMVRRGTLDTYKFLEHGAHYAVFVLAMTMLLSLIINIPEVITGILGLGLIGASIMASVQAKRANDQTDSAAA
ncbi:MAG TPA: DUF475 domain-containing protein [Candidatus Saccharimonadales bacterium]